MKTENEIIAEFMGVERKNHRIYITGRGGYIEKNYPNQLKYHNNWSWLMPVVIKAHEISDAKEKEFPEEKDLDDATGWRAWSYRRVGLSTNIERVYNNVVNFIKWYNSQPK